MCQGNIPAGLVCSARLHPASRRRRYQGALTPSAVGAQDGPNWYQSTALGLADVRARSLAIPGSIFLEDLLQYSQLLEDLLQYSQLLEDLLQYSQLLEDLLQYSQLLEDLLQYS